MITLLVVLFIFFVVIPVVLTVVSGLLVSFCEAVQSFGKIFESHLKPILTVALVTSPLTLIAVKVYLLCSNS